MSVNTLVMPSRPRRGGKLIDEIRGGSKSYR
jgi:hypothetical protein